MAQEQEADAKQSLISRVFGSKFAQSLGILGIGWTLFQGLEPFLKFSRFMAYLVTHWREFTRAIWSWLGSFVNLDLPVWALDLMTTFFFFVLFGGQCTTAGHSRTERFAQSKHSV
jgi:hypothetical protein